MDERPKQRIWNGDDYESDAEEDKSRHRSSNADALHDENVEMRSDISYILVLQSSRNPTRGISTSVFFFSQGGVIMFWKRTFRSLLGGIGDLSSSNIK